MAGEDAGGEKAQGFAARHRENPNVGLEHQGDRKENYGEQVGQTANGSQGTSAKVESRAVSCEADEDGEKAFGSAG